MNKILNFDLIYKKCHEDIHHQQQQQHQQQSRLSNQDAADAKCQAESIRIIHMDKCQISTICPDALSGFVYLQVLSLRDNNISFIDASTFRDCALLQELWLSGNLLTFIDPSMLQHLKKLKKLWLDNNRIKSIEPNTFDSLFHLKELWLANNLISHVNQNTFQLLVNLEELHLNDNQIRSLDVNAFTGLTNLREMNLYGNKISVLEPYVFAPLVNLQEFYFYNNKNYSIDARLFKHMNNLLVAELFIEATNNIREIHNILEADNNEKTTCFHPIFLESIAELELSKQYDSKQNYQYKDTYDMMYDQNQLSKSYNKGQFRALKLLGIGSFGKVYLVYDFIANKKMSLKILFNTIMSNEDCFTSITEAKFLKKFTSPYLIQYTDCFIEKDLFCIVLEYCDNGDLKGLINFFKHNEKRINKFRIFAWINQILQALHFLHKNNIIHRDVKPGNIFLNGINIKVGDLGLARNVSTIDRAKNLYSFVGTFSYMSPELINNKGYLFKSDIWSAGCILYEMITLEKAFNGSFFEICRAITDGVIPEVKTTPILEYLLKKMLEKSTDKRWDAHRLIKFLEPIKNHIQ